MKELFKSKKIMVVFVAAVAMVVSGGLAVVAKIPNSQTGVISACYRNSTSWAEPKGSLRLIDSQKGEKCTARETAVSWGQTQQTPQTPPAPQVQQIPTAMGRIDASGKLVDLKNVKSWTYGTEVAASGSAYPGYCLELPFVPYVMSVTDSNNQDPMTYGIPMYLKNEYSAYNYVFDQNGSMKYCPDAKYNVYIGSPDVTTGYLKMAFVIN